MVCALVALLGCGGDADDPLPPRTEALAPAPPVVLWHAGHEEAGTAEWGEDGGGTLSNSGRTEVVRSAGFAHSGSGSLQARIWTPGTSGVRAFRWKEPREDRELYFSVWIHVHPGTTVTGEFWNLFQFKSRSTDGRNDPVWALYGFDDGAGGIALRVGWGWGGTPLAGPRAGDGIGGRWFDPDVDMRLPTGRWVQVQAFLRQSKDFDGRVRFWVDGVEIVDLPAVRTSFPNCSYNSWCAANEWSVNLYADGLSPSPTTLHIDDATVSRRFVTV